MYVGFSLWWSSALSIVVTLLFSALLVLTAIKEEEIEGRGSEEEILRAGYGFPHQMRAGGS